MSSAETNQLEHERVGKKRKWNKKVNKSKKGKPKEANEAEDISSENSETDQEEHDSTDDKQPRKTIKDQLDKSNEAKDISSKKAETCQSTDEKRPRKSILKLINDPVNKSNEANDTSSKNAEAKPEEHEGMDEKRPKKTKDQLDEVDEAENISPKIVPLPRRKKRMFDIQCLGCGDDLEGPYIVCQECTDCCICLECFSEKYENEVHKKTHSYIIRTLDFGVLTDDWTAKEEIDLLNHLRIMSDYYAPLQTKTSEECKKHYEEFYVEKYADNGLPKVLVDKPEAWCAQPDHVRVIHSSNPPRYCANSDKTIFSMCGYSAGRGDFIVPHDDELEKEFTEVNWSFDRQNDQQPSKVFNNLELALVKGMSHRFDERERNNDIVMDFGLINLASNEKNLNEMKTKDPEGYNADITLRPIMRLNKDLHGYLELRYMMGREEEAIAKVKHLQDCRRNGVRTKKGAALYLIHKENRRKEDELRRTRSLAFHTEAQQKIHDFFNPPLPSKSKKSPAAIDRRRTIGGNKPLTTTVGKTKPGRRKTEFVHRNTIEASPNGNIATEQGPSKKMKTARRRPPMLSPKRKPSEPTNAFHKARLEFHKLLDDCTDVERLTGGEKELCKERRLHPKDYLFYKDRLIRCYERVGNVTLTVARKQLRIDNYKTRFIYDFLVVHGHIKCTKSS